MIHAKNALLRFSPLGSFAARAVKKIAKPRDPVEKIRSCVRAGTRRNYAVVTRWS